MYVVLTVADIRNILETIKNMVHPQVWYGTVAHPQANMLTSAETDSVTIVYSNDVNYSVESAAMT